MRLTLALVLAYLMLFRALIASLPPTSLPSGLDVLGSFPICAHQAATTPDDGGGAPVPANHACCDDCCLMRIAGLAPLILVAAFILAARLFGFLPVVRPRGRAVGPPTRLAARPQAQRAPPRLAFV